MPPRHQMARLSRRELLRTGPGAASRLRVLFISSAARRGGGRRAVWELMEALQRTGAEVTVFVRGRKPEDPPNVHRLRFGFESLLDRLVNVTGRDLDLRHVGSILRLARVRAGDVDVVHLHVLYGVARGWVSLRAIQRLARRLPTVWTFHDEWPILPGLHVDLHGVMPERAATVLGGTQPTSRDHPRVQEARRRLLPLLPRPAAIICPSRHLAERAADAVQFRGVPTHQVPHGLPFLRLAETRVPRDVARRALGLPLSSPVVLLVAAHLDDWFKGTPLAFEVFRRMQTPNARLVIVGDASERLRAAMPPSAIHLGYLAEDAALARAYRAADVVLMGSLGENFPYVALESLACETPVAAFRVGGLVEIVGDNERGVLAPPFDAADLAAAIDALLADDARRTTCGARGRRWVEATCDVERWVEAHLTVYRRAMAEFAGIATDTAQPQNRQAP